MKILRVFIFFISLFIISFVFTSCKQDAGSIRCDVKRVVDYTGRGNQDEVLLECCLRPERACHIQNVQLQLNSGTEDISRLSIVVNGKKIRSIVVKKGKTVYNLRCHKNIPGTVDFQICADIRPDAVEGNVVSVDVSKIEIGGEIISPTIPLPGGREILLCRKCLYAPGDYGSVAWRIPALLQLSDGTLIAVNDRRNDSEEDQPGCVDVVCRYSTDNGQTWSEPGYIARNQGYMHGVGDPGLAELPDGTVVCVFFGGEWGYRSSLANPQRSYVCFSHDHGRTWDMPQEITSLLLGPKAKNPQCVDCHASFFSSGNHLVLKNGKNKGRLLIANVCRYKGDEGYTNHVVYTDDGGKNWEVSDAVIREKGDEAKMVELPDGAILMSIRASGDRLWAKSYDGGETWNEFGKWPDIHVTSCNGDMIAYNDTLLLHSIPLSMQRENVSIMMSKDNGMTWSQSKIIMHGPSQYSSLTRLADGTIGAYIEKNTKGVELWFENFSLDWLLKSRTVTKQELMQGIQLWENGPYWAERNLGAQSPEQPGDFYAWGEIKSKKSFGWGTYTQDREDAATAVLGANWRMPLEADYIALKQKCKWKWKVINGYGGYEITGPNGHIFIPAGGYITGNRHRNARSIGQYWTSDTVTDKGAKEFYFNEQYTGECYYRGRDNGLPIRAVSDTKPR